ncbi:MAG: DUF4339 domain-containing protein [Pirellulales bacterium]
MTQTNSSDLWYLRQGETARGPYSLEQLRGWARDARITPDTYVCPVGADEWTEARTTAWFAEIDRPNEPPTPNSNVAASSIQQPNPPQKPQPSRAYATPPSVSKHVPPTRTSWLWWGMLLICVFLALRSLAEISQLRLWSPATTTLLETSAYLVLCSGFLTLPLYLFGNRGERRTWPIRKSRVLKFSVLGIAVVAVTLLITANSLPAVDAGTHSAATSATLNGPWQRSASRDGNIFVSHPADWVYLPNLAHELRVFAMQSPEGENVLYIYDETVMPGALSLEDALNVCDAKHLPGGRPAVSDLPVWKEVPCGNRRAWYRSYPMKLPEVDRVVRYHSFLLKIENRFVHLMYVEAETPSEHTSAILNRIIRDIVFKEAH